METLYRTVWLIVLCEMIGLNIFFRCRQARRNSFKEKNHLYHANGAVVGSPRLRSSYETCADGEREYSGFWVKAKYVYKVGGVSYTTKKYTFYKSEYEKGSLYPHYIDVWYHPKRPTEYVTNLDLRRRKYAGTIAGICIFTFFAWVGGLPLMAFLFMN